jgi:hypothetical protein
MKQQLKKALMRIPGGMFPLHAYRWMKKLRYDVETSRGVFTRYAKTNAWGDSESVSGAGSTIRYTENIRKEISVLIHDLGVTRILDAPCGDYNWFRLIPRHKGIEYIGGDIVEELIDANNRNYANDNTRFVRIDITRDRLPRADLWICRDALIHFSYRDIFLTLLNFAGSDIPYLLTTSYTEYEGNTDIPTGSFRQLNLQYPPFAFPEPILWIDDWIEGYPIRRLGLWDRCALFTSLADNRALQKVRNTRCRFAVPGLLRGLGAGH